VSPRRRPRPKKKREPLPPPLPPGERTVGQLVAEAARFYGAHFWRSLLLGIGPGAIAIIVAQLDRTWKFAFTLTGGAVILTAGFVGASVLVSPQPVTRRSLLRAFGIGLLVYLPVPFLAAIFVLPAIAWLAYVGLAVPAAVIENRGFRPALSRGMELARADYVHTVGALAALAIVGFLAQGVLFFVLRGAGEATKYAAAYLAGLIISPLLFLGAALLYFDQAARLVGSASRPRRRRNADLPADDDAHLSGRADAEGEPRPAAGGQS
jgi:hypothetical protein